LIGERVVRFRERLMPAATAWAELGMEPLVLQPKEGLALLNGTHVTSGIGGLALLGAERLVRVAEVATAMACEALGAIDGPFDPIFERVKPHPGLAASTAFIRWCLTGSRLVRSYQQVAEELPPLSAGGWRQLPTRVQDNYSLRCAPHCTGALRDCLTWAREWIEIEINSTNDNPLFDGESGTAHSGGNFSGFHVGLAMDSLKTAVASVADQADRQFALLVDEKLSNGLTPNLVAPLPDDHPEQGIHHGFKGVQLDHLCPDRGNAATNHADDGVLPLDGVSQPGQGLPGHRGGTPGGRDPGDDRAHLRDASAGLLSGGRAPGASRGWAGRVSTDQRLHRSA
jgi:histidine ammonia-lyase/phenylalanine ammonia-lyase